jgi:hypothetical protein
VHWRRLDRPGIGCQPLHDRGLSAKSTER